MVVTGIIVTLLLSALFAGSETVFLSFSRIYLPGWIKEKTRGAKSLQFLMERPERFLATTLTGNNLVNVAYSSLLTVFLTNYGVSEETIFIVAPLILLILGEALPKSLARLLADKIVLLLSQLTFALRMIFYPATKSLEIAILWIRRRFNIPISDVVDFLDRTEIKSAVEGAAENERLPLASKPLIGRLLNLEEMVVANIMTPRTSVAGVDVTSTVAEAKELLIQSGYSRLVAYGSELDNVVGLVDSRYLLSRSKNLTNIITPLKMVPESISCMQLLRWFKTEHTNIAGVVDEFGGFAGLVCLEDLVEEMLGPIQDEFDPVNPGIWHVTDNDWLVNGQMRLSQVQLLTGCRCDSRHSSTMGGFVVEIAGEIPDEGCRIEFPQGIARVISANKKGVNLVRLTINPPEDEK